MVIDVPSGWFELANAWIWTRHRLDCDGDPSG